MNKKSILIIIGASIILITGFIMIHSMDKYEAQHVFGFPLDGHTIYIDPGHGGKDGGASSAKGDLEKDITLIISHYLHDLLEEAGAFVYMTRTEDVDLASEEAHRQGRRKREDLQKRVELINESDADVVISLHLNSISSNKWRGAQTFYHPKLEENKKLAEEIQKAMTEGLQNTNRKAKATPNNYILKRSDKAGALVEAGFLSNPDEAHLLSDEAYQKKVASAIYQGILKYYEALGKQEKSQK